MRIKISGETIFVGIVLIIFAIITAAAYFTSGPAPLEGIDLIFIPCA